MTSKSEVGEVRTADEEWTPAIERLHVAVNEEFAGRKFTPDPAAWEREPPPDYATPSRMRRFVDRHVDDLSRQGASDILVERLRAAAYRAVDVTCDEMKSRLAR